MPRPSLEQLAEECDGWRELAMAGSRYAISPNVANERRMKTAAEALIILGISNFSPPARERIREPERLGDILQREGLMATQALDEGFVWEGEDDEPSEIANVIGHTLGKAGR